MVSSSRGFCSSGAGGRLKGALGGILPTWFGHLPAGQGVLSPPPPEFMLEGRLVCPACCVEELRFCLGLLFGLIATVGGFEHWVGGFWLAS